VTNGVLHRLTGNQRGSTVRSVRSFSILVVIGAIVGVLVLTGCTAGPAGTPTAEPAAVASASSASAAAAASSAQKVAADQAAAVQSAAEKAAADKAAADQAAADQAAADKLVADKLAADQAAADQAAAEQAAAERSSAEQAATEKAAAQQAAAEQAAAEQAAAEQAAAESSAASVAAQADSGVDGWYTPSGNWVSPETAARAIAAGISPGETVPNYLRCGTICGEGPTSGEVQWAHACQDGTVPAEECVGIDPAAIIAAASGYSGW
jgi:hypothetical protein